MGQATIWRRWKMIWRRWKTKTQLFINGGLLFLAGLFIFSFWFTITVWGNKSVFATSIMALAIVATAGILLVSIRQNLHMLTLNQRMIDEMRRGRPKPLVVAHIKRASTGPGYRLVVENKGRESAHGIKVRYCQSEIPENIPEGVVHDESKLVDSPWVKIKVMPLGLGDKQEFEFGRTISPRIWYFKFAVTFSDGVETRTDTYQQDADEIEWG